MPTHPIYLLLAKGCALFFLAQGLNASDPTFEKHIRPILKAHCFHCHGEGDELKGNLDLRLRRTMVEAKKEGEFILVPEDPEKSLLVRLIRSGEMPKGEKKLGQKEIDLITRWVAAGAPTTKQEPVELPLGFSITDDERMFWSFQPIRRPQVPNWLSEDNVRTSVDVFILEKLKQQNLGFAPPADKNTLIRRAYLDLLGIPPTPEQVEAFLKDSSPDAFERLLDHLLQSPFYGERWGRHWLDLAGYAESNGFAEADSLRPHAWRYRDYVIRSFNADKPWTEFIQEQIAGDELAGVTQEDAVTKAADSKVQELLAATGFLRMAPDGTGDEVPDQKIARNMVLTETVKIVSSSLLGLTVGCAECHDHRYEPISQQDYYRMRALFEPAMDPKNWRNPNQRLVSLYTPEDRQKAEAIEAEARKIDEAANQMRKDFLEEVFQKELAKLPDEIREIVKEARNTPSVKRTSEQIALLKKHPSADVQGALDLYDPEAHKKVQEKQGEASKLRATKPPEPFLSPFTEVAQHLPETFLFHRGDPDQPKEKIPPAEMEILRPAFAAWHSSDSSETGFGPKAPGMQSSGRRLAYARWLTSGQHPLVARIIVNRVWLHHFGRGLVATPSDFGLGGQPPTHPELLDWLASEFMANGWKLKSLHKLIMTSAVYRQSSRNDLARDADPDNTLFARMQLRRLEAEPLRDAILAVSGSLNPEQFGPSTPVAQDEAGRIVPGIQKTNGNGDPVLVEPLGKEAFRRSIYLQVRRSLPLTVLDAFDAPILTPNCELRNNTTVAPQALTMLNDSFVIAQSELFAERLLKEYPGDARAQVKRAWQLAFSAHPTEKELLKSLAFLAEQAEQFRVYLASREVKETTGGRHPQSLALASFCHSLLSANRFLYVE